MHATRRYLQLLLIADGFFPLYTLQARVQAASALLARRQILMAVKEPWTCSCHSEITSLHCSSLFVGHSGLRNVAVLLERREHASPSSNLMQETCPWALFLCLEPRMLSSVNVMEVPPCPVRALSSAHRCPGHALALPIAIVRAHDVLSSCHDEG